MFLELLPGLFCRVRVPAVDQLNLFVHHRASFALGLADADIWKVADLWKARCRKSRLWREVADVMVRN